tara:strand:- start:3708 stop:4160 length:453 start_codon:yes stop_codon:yes gene_type:complete
MEKWGPVEATKTYFKNDILVYFKLVYERVKKQDIQEFLIKLEEFYLELKEKDEQPYFIWNINVLSVLPPSYIQTIIDLMPKLRELGESQSKGSAVIFPSSSIRTILNKYLVQYNIDPAFIKFVKNYDFSIDYLKCLGLKMEERVQIVAYA